MTRIRIGSVNVRFVGVTSAVAREAARRLGPLLAGRLRRGTDAPATRGSSAAVDAGKVRVTGASSAEAVGDAIGARVARVVTARLGPSRAPGGKR